jgi:hypothetical protein
MKRLFIYLFAVIAISTVSCKGTANKNSDGADSGQTHVSGSVAADSNKYPASPTETGGQDTSMNGADNMAKDTLKKD